MRSSIKKNPITEEEKRFIDENYQTVTVLEMMQKFKRKAGRVYYEYMYENEMTPFVKGKGKGEKRSKSKNDGLFFKEEAGDWLTGKH